MISDWFYEATCFGREVSTKSAYDRAKSLYENRSHDIDRTANREITDTDANLELSRLPFHLRGSYIGCYIYMA